jgi:hypothetical protein
LNPQIFAQTASRFDACKFVKKKIKHCIFEVNAKLQTNKSNIRHHLMMIQTLTIDKQAMPSV